VQAALSNTRIPKVEVLAGEGDEEGELELNDDPDECARVSTADVPVIVTLTKVSDNAHTSSQCFHRMQAKGVLWFPLTLSL
jgi:hypothetical protein